MELRFVERAVGVEHVVEQSVSEAVEKTLRDCAFTGTRIPTSLGGNPACTPTDDAAARLRPKISGVGFSFSGVKPTPALGTAWLRTVGVYGRPWAISWLRSTRATRVPAAL
jgi:hypothetical protein